MYVYYMAYGISAYQVFTSLSFPEVIIILHFLGVFLDSATNFTVDAKSVTPRGKGKVRAVITNPSGAKSEGIVTNNMDGTYDVAYTPHEQGQYKVRRKVAAGHDRISLE